MKRAVLTARVVSSLALAAPVAYFVVKDGAPDTFEAQVVAAYNAWLKVPATTLGVQSNPNATTRYSWGGDKEIAFNPDVATRTLETTEGATVKIEVQINPEQPVDLPSALLIESGLRLGLDLEAGIDGKRSVGEAEIKALRALYSPNGDMNGDGRVDVDDLELFSVAYGKRGERLPGDFNGDRAVDDKDLEILRSNYVYGGEPQVPKLEPVAPVTPAPTPTPTPTPAPTTPATPPAPPATPPVSPAPPASPVAPAPPAPDPAPPVTPPAPPPAP